MLYLLCSPATATYQSLTVSNLIRERRGEANREAGAVELGEERERKVLLGWNDKLAFAEQNF